MSLNPAWLNDSFRVSMSDKAKGPGVVGGGAGAFICFLTLAKAKPSNGTLGGEEHKPQKPRFAMTAVDTTKADGRLGKEHHDPY